MIALKDSEVVLIVSVLEKYKERMIKIQGVEGRALARTYDDVAKYQSLCFEAKQIEAIKALKEAYHD